MTALAQGCLVFMLVASPAEERQANLLIESLRQVGGPLAECRHLVVLAGAGHA